MDPVLDTAFLISKLVQKLRPNSLKSLAFAVDLIRTFHFGQPDFPASHFEERWRESLARQGKDAQIKIVERCMSSLIAGTNRPHSVFLMLDRLRGSPSVPEVPNISSIVDSDIPGGFFFVLQGLEGENFKWHSKRNRFVSSERLHPSLHELSRRVSEIGCMVRSLQEYLTLTDSLIHQYIAVSVQQILIDHLNFVGYLECSMKQLTRHHMFSLLLSPVVCKLRATTLICNTLKQMRAASPYNVLHLLASHGDPVIADIACLLRDKAMECIERMVKSWASKGQVEDPFSEFFIRCKGSAVVYSNWWHDCYFVAQGIVPSAFTEETIELIMSAGKALNFMRKFAEPVELAIDNSLPLQEFLQIAARDANGHILNLIMKDGLLPSAIADIHDFMLLGRGDFAAVLLDSRPNMVPILLLRFAKRVVPNLSFRGGEKDGFVFDPKPPLSSVIGPYEVQAYKAVSALLVRVRRSMESLRRIEKPDRLTQLFVWELQSFVTLVYDFFHAQVIVKSYSALKEVLRDPNLTFDQLLAEHARHTSNIARGCWVSKSGQDCRLALMDLLAVVDVVGGGEPPARLREKFREMLFKFRTMLLGHHVSGRALVGAVTSRFRHILG
jgi:hypothetical protein